MRSASCCDGGLQDLSSQNMYDAGVALNGLACFVSPDLARDLANDIMTLVRSLCLPFFAYFVNLACRSAVGSASMFEKIAPPPGLL